MQLVKDRRQIRISVVIEPLYMTIIRSEAVASIFPQGENLATLTTD